MTHDPLPESAERAFLELEDWELKAEFRELARELVLVHHLYN